MTLVQDGAYIELMVEACVENAEEKDILMLHALKWDPSGKN